MLELTLNIVIIVLLIVGILYAVILESRFTAAKSNHRALKQLIDQFYQAAHKIQGELAALQTQEENVRHKLQADLTRACGVRDEIVALIAELEQKSFTITQKTVGAPVSPETLAQMTTNEQDIDSLNMSDSEKELLKALNALK